MKAKVARRVLRERDALRKKIEVAADAEEGARKHAAFAAERRDHLRGPLEANQEKIRDLREALRDAEDEQRSLEARHRELEEDVATALEVRDQLAKVVEGLSSRLNDPRFAEAERVVAQAEARKAEMAVQAANAAPLSAENVEGLKLLRRAFDPSKVKRPSHRVVHESGETYEMVDEDVPDVDVDTSIPCPECGAKTGEPCDESKPHEGDDE